MKIRLFKKYFYFIAIYLLLCPLPVFAYSVLTHEAIIDATWDKSIQPLLLEKFPGSTESQLKEAHAYAYGGCVAPDMGYYPFGSKLFTQLVHYVRTGDLVNNLLDEARDINEYAFALGFLCHYNADKYGHPIATNKCVPLVYPKDKEQFGSVVTYEQDPITHVRMEFGFDVIQTARGNYASEKYHDFIGFKVARPVLERAFLKTYGININDLFKDFSLSIETFRWIIKNFFPTITKAAWVSKRAEIRKSNPTITKKKFEYKMQKTNYYHEYGRKHEKPGFFPGVISVFVRILPKVGALKDLKIKIPGPDGEKLFIQSFDTVLVHFTSSLNRLHHNTTRYPNIDFDTGNDTSPGEYSLADATYIELLLKVKDGDFKNVNKDLKQNIINFYSPCNEKIAAMAGSDQWKEITLALDTLKKK